MKIFFLFFLLSACEQTSSLDPADHRDKDTISLKQLNDIISNADAGDTVHLKAAVYIIDGNIEMTPGITLKGVSTSETIFDARTDNDELFEINYETPGINNCTFLNISFYNIKMKFNPESDYAIKGIVFDNCKFDYGRRKPGTDEKSYTNDGYIAFIKTEDFAIRNCTFLRRKGNDGRGVFNKYTKNTIIEYNNWGGDDPDETGYFVTAINERGFNSVIRHNVISKHSTWAPLEKQDHGIYAIDFDGVTIRDNRISGWQPNGSGGSIKARNGQHLVIEDNTFINSGILLYVYETEKIQQQLKNILVKNNAIEIIGGDSTPSIYNGIGYWTDTDYKNEFSIRIEGNTITNGFCVMKSNRINDDGFNANGGGLYNNNCIEIHIKSGINHSHNKAKIVEY